MTGEEYQSVVAACDLQEQVIRAEHFSHEDMLELGLFIVNEAKRRGVSLSVAISKPSGAVVFQHLMEGTNAGNQGWMARKAAVCRELEHCTLRAWAKEVLTGETLADYGMNPAEHVFCGGAFPVRLKTGEFVGIVAISGFAHFLDHQFGVDCLGKWLGMEEVPQVPFFDVWRE